MNDLIKTIPKKEEKNNPLKYDNDKNNILISWIIIGQNWKETAQLLLESLNTQDFNSQSIELILSSAIDAVGANAPQQTLTKARCSHLPLTGSLQNL